MLGGGNGSGNYGGGMFGGGGNAAGGQGMLGGGHGFTGNNAAGSGGSGMINLGTGGSGLLDLGTIGSAALGLAGHIPGPVGMGFTAANLLGRAYNTYQTDNIREQQGLPALSLAQWASGLSGVGGGYGSLDGGATIANPSQFTDRMNQLFSQNRLYSGGTLPGSSLAETNNGDPYNSFHLGPFALGTNTPALSYNTTQQLLNRINTGQAVPYDTPTTYAPTGVMNPPKPIMRADGTIIGYANPDGSSTSAAGANALGFSGGGAPGSPMGGQYGNNGVATGGMAGPVNRNSATGMLSRI